MYKLCWERKIDVGMEFNLINTADKLLLLLMAAAIMRHFVIIVTSNNTVIRWQRMELWGHRRQSCKRRPQSKHKAALLIPGACSSHPSHISFLNCSLLLTAIYHSQCKSFPGHIFWESLTPKPCPAMAGASHPRTCQAFPARAAALPLSSTRDPTALGGGSVHWPNWWKGRRRRNIWKLKHHMKDGWVLLNPKAKIRIPGLKTGFTSTPLVAVQGRQSKCAQQQAALAALQWLSGQFMALTFPKRWWEL